MSGESVVIAGEKEAGAALSGALSERGIDSRFLETSTLPEALVGIEEVLEQGRPDAAVAVGFGGEALALAITAAKLGVPLAFAGGGEARDGRDEDRILTTLAELDAGSETAGAADLIASWLRDDHPRPT